MKVGIDFRQVTYCRSKCHIGAQKVYLGRKISKAV